jgi:hypothetical protein
MKCGDNGGSPKSNFGSHQNFNGYFSGMLFSLSLSLSLSLCVCVCNVPICVSFFGSEVYTREVAIMRHYS